jgi:hypothetical protein
MGIQDARSFLLASYHDLPNILLAGSLLLGSLTGYLPLVWMALGLILNAVGVMGIKEAFAFLDRLGGQKGWFHDQLYKTGKAYSLACSTGYQKVRSLDETGSGFTATGDLSVTPSYWISAIMFFSAFSITNSAKLLSREDTTNADKTKINNRRAFSISALMIGIFFLGCILLRIFTGCETPLGLLTGILVGGGLGIGYWFLLDACGSGKVPDLLQVVASMAPEGTDTQTPVVCTPTKE